MTIPELILPDRVTIFSAPTLDDEGNLTGGTTVLGTSVHAFISPIQSDQAASLVGELGRVVVRIFLPPEQACNLGSHIIVESSAAFQQGTVFIARGEPETFVLPFASVAHHREVIATRL